MVGLGCAPKQPPRGSPPDPAEPVAATPTDAPPATTETAAETTAVASDEGFPDPYPNAGEFDSLPQACPDFKIPAVREVCESGGHDAVETLMQEATKKAVAAGNDYDCGTCHNLYYRMVNADAATLLKPWI